MRNPSNVIYHEVARTQRRLRVGLDLDGVLADWFWAFTGFAHRRGVVKRQVGAQEASSWDLLAMGIGFTEETLRETLAALQGGEGGEDWLERAVPLTPDGLAVSGDLAKLSRLAEVHVITARDLCYPGQPVVVQTRHWLQRHLPGFTCGLVMAEDKAGAVNLLGLDVYLDDRWENARAVADRCPNTQAYLVARLYNMERWSESGSICWTTLPGFVTVVLKMAREEVRGLGTHGK